jgi:hypothetical protein
MMPPTVLIDPDAPYLVRIVADHQARRWNQRHHMGGASRVRTVRLYIVGCLLIAVAFNAAPLIGQILLAATGVAAVVGTVWVARWAERSVVHDGNNGLADGGVDPDVDDTPWVSWGVLADAHASMSNLPYSLLQRHTGLAAEAVAAAAARELWQAASRHRETVELHHQILQISGDDPTAATLVRERARRAEVALDEIAGTARRIHDLSTAATDLVAAVELARGANTTLSPAPAPPDQPATIAGCTRHLAAIIQRWQRELDPTHREDRTDQGGIESGHVDPTDGSNDQDHSR